MVQAEKTTYQITKEMINAATGLAIQAAREDLLAFVKLIDPDFSLGPHHRLICDMLMGVEANVLKRLMIFVAPRSSKSLISSVYFPAWCLGRRPDLYFIEVSHNTTLASRFGRQVRDLISTETFHAIFPETDIKKGDGRADDWSTSSDGRFLSAGANTGIAGSGAHIGIIDDPLSEQDAWSKTARDKVIQWYPGGFRSRLMPKKGRVVIINTRWHEGDLSGWLESRAAGDKKVDQWDIVRIPALNTKASAELLNSARAKMIDQGYLPAKYPKLKVGESFWPAPSPQQEYYWDTEELLATQAELPDYQWNALYQQNPSAEDGGVLKTRYWRKWKGDEPPICDHILCSVDTAFSTKERADYSAVTTWGVFKSFNKEHLILLGAKKGHWSYPELRRELIKSYEFHEPDSIVIENKASGQSLIQDLSMYGLPIFAFQPDKDKETRVHAISPMFAQGRVFYPHKEAWTEAVLEECRQFPLGQHDDYVDTVSQALLYVRNGSYVIPPDNIWNDIEEDGIIESENKRRYY